MANIENIANEEYVIVKMAPSQKIREKFTEILKNEVGFDISKFSKDFNMTYSINGSDYTEIKISFEYKFECVNLFIYMDRLIFDASEFYSDHNAHSSDLMLKSIDELYPRLEKFMRDVDGIDNFKKI